MSVLRLSFNCASFDAPVITLDTRTNQRRAFHGKFFVDSTGHATVAAGAIEAIVTAAKTGKVGDGKIFVTEIERVLRIRTGEADDAAL